MGQSGCNDLLSILSSVMNPHSPISRATQLAWCQKSTPWNGALSITYPIPWVDSINNHFPKDPYSLQHVRVDDAISILKSLGPGAYMAKTDLKSAFRIMPIHPDDWNLLGI